MYIKRAYTAPHEEKYGENSVYRNDTGISCFKITKSSYFEDFLILFLNESVILKTGLYIIVLALPFELLD